MATPQTTTDPAVVPAVAMPLSLQAKMVVREFLTDPQNPEIRNTLKEIQKKDPSVLSSDGVGKVVADVLHSEYSMSLSLMTVRGMGTGNSKETARVDDLLYAIRTVPEVFSSPVIGQAMSGFRHLSGDISYGESARGTLASRMNEIYEAINDAKGKLEISKQSASDPLRESTTKLLSDLGGEYLRRIEDGQSQEASLKTIDPDGSIQQFLKSNSDARKNFMAAAIKAGSADAEVWRDRENIGKHLAGITRNESAIGALFGESSPELASFKADNREKLQKSLDMFKEVPDLRKASFSRQERQQMAASSAAAALQIEAFLSEHSQK